MKESVSPAGGVGRWEAAHLIRGLELFEGLLRLWRAVLIRMDQQAAAAKEFRQLGGGGRRAWREAEHRPWLLTRPHHLPKQLILLALHPLLVLLPQTGVGAGGEMERGKGRGTRWEEVIQGTT